MHLFSFLRSPRSHGKISRTILMGFLLTMHTIAQADGTISGQIRDSATKAPIPFANIFISGCTSVKSLEDGAYIVDCPPGNEYRIEVSADGYSEKQISPISIQNNSFVQHNIFLDKEAGQNTGMSQQNFARQDRNTYQGSSNYQNNRTFKKPISKRQTSKPSEKSTYFAKLAGKIAADRVAKRYEKNKKQRRQNGSAANDCESILSYGTEEDIINSGCGNTYQDEGAYQGENTYQDEAANQGENTYQDEAANQDEGAYQGENTYQDEGAYQGENTYQDEGAYQEPVENRRQLAKSSNKTEYFSKLIGKIAADRVVKRHERLKAKRKRKNIKSRPNTQNNSDMVDCNEVLARGDPAEIEYYQCGEDSVASEDTAQDSNGAVDCNDVLARGDPAEIEYYQCGDGQNVAANETQNSPEAADCNEVLARGDPAEIEDYQCGDGQNVADQNVAANETQNSPEAVNCNEVLARGDPAEIEHYQCDNGQNIRPDNRPAPAISTNDRRLLDARQIPPPQKPKRIQIQSNINRFGKQTNIQGLAQSRDKNNAGNRHAPLKLKNISISNKRTVVKLRAGGPPSKLKLMGKNLNKITSILVIEPNGKKSPDISAALNKRSSRNGRHVIIKSKKSANIKKGFYRIVMLSGKKALTIKQNRIKIIVGPANGFSQKRLIRPPSTSFIPNTKLR